MGYQESLLKVNNVKSFNNIIKYLNKNSKRLAIYVDLTTVVVFKKEVVLRKGVIFKAEEKCVCITGDRCGHKMDFLFEQNKIACGCRLHAIEEFQEIDGIYVGMDMLNKMFKTHEVVSEIPFKEYIQ